MRTVCPPDVMAAAYGSPVGYVLLDAIGPSDAIDAIALIWLAGTCVPIVRAGRIQTVERRS